jgi:hypothetical protein
MIYHDTIKLEVIFMYDADFWERASITQLVEFIKNGTESCKTDTGTYEERQQRYSKAFIASLYQFRDMVLKTDWETIEDDHDRDSKTESMYGDIMQAYSDQIDLAFEVGVVVGFQLGQEFVLKIKGRA